MTLGRRDLGSSTNRVSTTQGPRGFGSAPLRVNTALGQGRHSFGSTWLWLGTALGQLGSGSAWLWVSISQGQHGAGSGSAQLCVSMALGQGQRGFGSVWSRELVYELTAGRVCSDQFVGGRSHPCSFDTACLQCYLRRQDIRLAVCLSAHDPAR